MLGGKTMGANCFKLNEAPVGVKLVPNWTRVGVDLDMAP